MPSLTSVLRELDEVPNVPFFTGEILETVRGMTKSMGLRGSRIWDDSLGLYVSLKRGRPTQRVFLCSHLDHPGFVFNENGIATPLGSVGGIGNRSISAISRLAPMDLYTKGGRFLDTLLMHVKGNQLEAHTKLPVNTIGRWHLENTSYTPHALHMRSADNHVATAMALQVATDIWDTSEDVDLTLVFTTVEEIYQISMSGICLRGSLGKPIQQGDIFFVVEAMEMVASQGGSPNYSAGPLIKVNDDEVGYGNGSRTTVNVAEAKLIKAASNLRHQHTYSGGYTDATALSLLTTCPNIATVAIPCRNKHNINVEGAVTTEQVQTGDVMTGIQLLKAAILSRETESTNLLSVRMRGSVSQRKRQERVKVYRNNRVRLAWEFYYPQNPIHWLGLALNRVF